MKITTFPKKTPKAESSSKKVKGLKNYQNYQHLESYFRGIPHPKKFKKDKEETNLHANAQDLKMLSHGNKYLDTSTISTKN